MRNTLCAVALAVLSVAFNTTVFAQQPVLQRGYDAGLSGANLSETTLTTSNVNSTTFGLVFTLPVDDRIYAQPLYVPNVVMMQGTHNVVYVATMSDTLYAFDADVGGEPLWSVNFASSVGAVPVAFANFTFGGNTNIVGNLGILSTPVIDPSTNIMYLVACTLEGGTMVYRLHAVDITNGTEPYTNVVIAGSYGGVTFDAPHQTQRASLTLSGNQVVFGFAAVEAETDDEGGYSGWVMAYNKQTLAQSGIFASVTTGGTLGGGVWQSGRPPVVDSAGFVYVFTGNGYTNGYNGVSNFSESVLKLNPASGLALVDWFTPDNWSTMDADDLDLASSGPLLIPGTSPSLLAGGGKTGVLYVLNTSNLGHYSATDSGVVQEETIGASSLRGGPVYWQRSAANGGPLLYDWASSDWVKAYAFNGTTFASSPTYQGSGTFVYPGGILALSANGQQQGTGVLWGTVAASGNVYNDATDPGVLYAFDADNVATELYTSTTNSARDNFGNFAKFVPPLVAKGKVYVATFSDQVAVYGLLSQSTPTAATPTFSLASGNYTSAQQVTLSDTTSGAVIYYTTNGTTPTTSSAHGVSGTVLSISTTTTLEAMAVASGYTNSTVAVGTYTISATPVSVSLSAADTIVGIGNVGTAVSGGGLDGSGNVYAASLLGTSLTWSGSTFALGNADVADAVNSATITLPAGNYSSVNLLATGVDGNQANQTFVVTYTDGTTTIITQSLSDWFTPQNYAGESIASTMAYRVTSTGATDNRTFYLYGYSFAINSAKTVQSITLPNNRNVVVLGIDVVPTGGTQPPAATPTFSLASGTYTGTQQVTLSDATSGAVIYYTTNGATPTTSSAHGVSGTVLSISTTTTLEAMAVASGYSYSAVAVGTYTISTEPAAATPTFSLASGNYTSAQQVTLSDTTSGAVIYYTTNGTTPTTSSAHGVSGTVLSISTTTTLEAMAVASGYSYSAVAVGTYTIGTTPVSVSLSAADTIVGIGNVGTAVSGGGLDGDGNVYAGSLLGTSLTWSGSTFALGNADVADAVSGATITLPAGNYSSVNLLATGVDGNQANQTFVVTYTDGTTTIITQSLSDWFTPQNYAGESIASTMAYRVTSTGATDNRTFYLYGYSFAINSAKTVQSITLPNNRNVVVLGIDVVPTGGTQPPAATPTFSLASGTYTGTQQVTLSDATSGAVIYYTTNGATPTTSSAHGVSGTVLSISTTTTLEAMAVASGYSYSAVAVGTYTISTEPAAATPTFSLASGNYTSAQQVTLSDTTSGAVIYYTTNGTTPTTSSAAYAGGSLSISTTTTLEAMAVASGYSNSTVAVATYTIGTTPVSVSLSAADTIVGIGNIGTVVSGGGIDGSGNVYAGSLLGTSLTWSGSTFALGNADVADAVSGATITLPAGNYSSVNLLATGVDGNQGDQTFVVTYTDGTTTIITQSLSDWFTPQNYAGESIASTMAYRVTSTGATDNRTFYLYGYSFAINSAKTVQSITLPNNRNVVVLSLELVP